MILSGEQSSGGSGSKPSSCCRRSRAWTRDFESASCKVNSIDCEVMDHSASTEGYIGRKRQGKEICKICFARSPEDRKLYEHARGCRSQAQHFRYDRVFVTWCEEDSKMVPVRPPPDPSHCKITSGKFFRLCQVYPDKCKHGNTCRYAHGHLELEVWNTWLAHRREQHLQKLSYRSSPGIIIYR